MGTVLLEAHHLAIVIRTPDYSTLMIHPGTGRANEKHMTASGTRLRAHMLGIISGVPGLLHEHGELLLRGDLVQNVIEQAGEDPISAGAVRDPEPTFGETETAGKLDELGVGRDDLVECRVSFGD